MVDLGLVCISRCQGDMTSRIRLLRILLYRSSDFEPLLSLQRTICRSIVIVCRLLQDLQGVQSRYGGSIVLLGRLLGTSEPSWDTARRRQDGWRQIWYLNVVGLSHFEQFGKNAILTGKRGPVLESVFADTPSA